MEPPMGYKFIPSDEELILYYLIPKVAKRALPINIMYEVELKNYNPETLAENYKPQGEKMWYIFTQRDKKYKNGERPNRVAGDGYWKASGSEHHVMHNGRKIGSKKSLVFYRGKHPNGKKTNWIMYEYTVYRSSRQSRQTLSQNDMRLHEWVLCEIHEHHRSTRNINSEADDEINDNQENNIMVHSLDQNSVSNSVQNNNMTSFHASELNVINADNVIQDYHATSSQPPERNMMNPNERVDISTDDYYGILFGSNEENTTNPNEEDSISIQDRCTTISQQISQNISHSNTLNNDSFVGEYGDFFVDQVHQNYGVGEVEDISTLSQPPELDMLNTNVEEDISTDDYFEILFVSEKNTTNSNVEENISIQDQHPNIFNNGGSVGGYGGFSVDQVHQNCGVGVGEDTWTWSLSSEPNTLNPNVGEDILTDDDYEILFGSKEKDVTNPNKEENISIQDQHPNIFSNGGLVGGYGNFSVDQVHQNCSVGVGPYQSTLDACERNLLIHCQKIFSSPHDQFL